MFSINDLPKNKLLAKGAAALNDVELLQVIIGSGTKDNDFKQISKSLNALIVKRGIDNITFDDLLSVPGVGDTKASAFMASLEFFRRRFVKSFSPLISSPEHVYEQVRDIAYKKQEHFVLLTLDGARRLINKHTVTVGTLMSCPVHPREIFSLAIEDRAASIIVAHNHPSMLLDISESDREVTRRIRESGDLIGIRLDDHIIVAGDDYTSVF